MRDLKSYHHIRYEISIWRSDTNWYWVKLFDLCTAKWYGMVRRPVEFLAGPFETELEASEALKGLVK